MVQADKWFLNNANIIEPFLDKLHSVNDAGEKVISYGLSSYGYDVRLSSREMLLLQQNTYNSVIDPKKFDQQYISSLPLLTKGGDSYFLIPAHSYALGVSIERFDIPNNVTAIVQGKSTYARCGIIVNVTPLESGWKGYVTLEFANTSPCHVKMYVNEGVAQIIFFEGNPCQTSYADRNGKYQDQPQKVVFAK